MADDQYWLVNCTGLNQFVSGVLVGGYDPPAWYNFGTSRASGPRDVVTSYSPWIHRLATTQGDLPIEVDGVLVKFQGLPSGGTYAIYQLRTAQVPGTLPTAAASGSTTGVSLVDVPLTSGAGSFVYITVLDSGGERVLSTFTNNGDGTAVYSRGPRAALIVYGGLEGQGGVNTLAIPFGRMDFQSDAFPNMQAVSGDIVIMHPSGVAEGTVLHGTAPTIVRYGDGAPAAPNQTGAGIPTDVPTPSGRVSVLRPVFDVTGDATQTSAAQILIPKNYFYGKTSPVSCSAHQLLNVGPAHNWGAGIDFSLEFTVPAPAQSDITPTTSLYTGVYAPGAVSEIVIPGTDGMVVIGTIRTPLFPEGTPPAAPADPTAFLGDANGFTSVNRYLGHDFFAAYIAQSYVKRGTAECVLIPDLYSFPTGPPAVQVDGKPFGIKNTHDRVLNVRGTYYYFFDWLIRHDDTVIPVPDSHTFLSDFEDAEGFNNVNAKYELTCRAERPDGTRVTATVEHTFGTPAESPTGAERFRIAYNANEFGWGAPDLFGFGLVGVMGILSAMAGFSRKNIPASAVIFAVVIAGMGWMELMNITEALMSAITVATILIVFQRSGGKG